MPTDVSHLPPAPIRCQPLGPHDDRDAITAWQTHLAAGHLGATPPAPPYVVAGREATAAQFAAYRDDARRLACAR